MNALRSIVVAAAAGIRRDALVSLLRAQPNITVDAVVDDIAAVPCITAAGKTHVVILDTGLEPEKTVSLIQWLRQNTPAVRCIVLADNTALRATCLQAGAADVLLKGCLDETMLAVVGN